MEREKQSLMEMIDRPVFTVQNGIITDCNQTAKNRQIPVGKPISVLMPDYLDQYENYNGGVLYMTLQLGSTQCGTTVIRHQETDYFLMDRDSDLQHLQALALAAQQLRTPLSNVMVLGDILYPKLQDADQQETATQMRKALFQLMRMIGNMADAERYIGLDLSSFENTDLCKFFEEVFQKAGTSLEKTDIRIHFTCESSRIITLADRERLERAVYNILSNAVKFSKPGSVIEAKLTKSGKYARLTIEDQGDGIADHAKGNLFHRYMREPAIEDSRFGMGRGMTFIRSVAAAHGGTVLLENTGGTRVTMCLAVRKNVPARLCSPQMRIGNYAGGYDLGLLEFSESLPIAAYEETT